MKKTIRIVSVLLITVILIMAGSTLAMASADYDTRVNDLLSGQDNSNLSTVGKQIISIITTVGIIVAVVVLLVLGIKYMMGSASEKAEYKKTMIPYIIGAVLVFGASAVAKFVISIATQVQV